MNIIRPIRRRSLWLCVSVCLLLGATTAGCARRGERLLIGKWRSSRQFTQLPTADTPNDDAGAADENISSASTTSPGIVLTFYRSGRLETTTNQGQIHTEKSGTWELLYYEPEQKSAVIRCELIGQKTEHTVTFIDSDTIRLQPPNLAGLDEELTFHRIQ